MTIKLGSKGPEVRELQKLLNAATKVGLFEDGIFGAATEKAVMEYQQKTGLVIDGIAGLKTLGAMKDPRTLKHALKQADIMRAAAALGVNVATVMAVNEVESAGVGFLLDRPVILFERHIFCRQLIANGMQKQEVARLQELQPQLVNNRPGGYFGGILENQRLQAAVTINESAALESCSWGAYQIMGLHWQKLGFESVRDFVTEVSKDEGAQLSVFVLFIKSDKALHKALKSKKWVDFAAIYNGPAYAKNAYDLKLASAYQKYSELLSADATA